MRTLIERNGFWFFISFATLVLYLLPLLLYGENLYIRIHDNLDITVPSLKILAHSGMIFAGSMEIIPNMMGGLPRLVYGSEFNYLLWLFVFFKPFTAMLMNEVLIHCVAYVSMLLFLRYFLRDKEVDFKPVITHLSSLLFALTPFFPATGLGVALLPSSLYVLLKIRVHSDTKRDWLMLIVIPFFSSFVLVYLFFLISVTVLFLAEMIFQKKINHRLFTALGLMTIIFLGIEYRLVNEMLFGSDFISHRTEFQRQYVDFWGAYRGAHNVLLFGQVHSLNLQFPYLLSIIHLGFFIALLRQRLAMKASVFSIVLYTALLFAGLWESVLMSKYYFPFSFGIILWLLFRFKEHRILYGVWLFVLISSLWYGFWYYEPWCNFSQHVPLLQTFDFSRFVLLLTPVWYALVAYSSVIIIQKIRFGIVIVIIVVIAQLNFAFDSAQFTQNPKGLTYKSFYDEKLFDEIKLMIGENPTAYRVASVGIPPAVALYNGLYTLDGYAANYPLSYKHQFEALVGENFIHNPNSRRFIQNWGSKCYLIGGNYDADEYHQDEAIEYFYMDLPLFYQMGGRYLLSGYKIMNEKESHLILLKIFTSKESYWTIYLYKTYS
ncbi:MAG: DUF6044 family protein [Pseudomonadota bacterium]